LTPQRRCEGFDRLPSGFYTNNGFGLTGAGVEILQEVTAKYKKKKIALTVAAKGEFRIDGRGREGALTIPHKLLTTINSEKRSIRSQGA